MHICLASTPADLNYIDLPLLYSNKYYLMSMLFLKDTKLSKEYYGEAVKRNFLLIDSGAHTFQKLENNLDGLDKWIKIYIQFLKKNQDYWNSYVEMDIDNRIGYKQVAEIRQHLWDETGVPPMPVWHGKDHYYYNDGFNRTIQNWKNYCKTFPYVGLSGATPVQYLPKMLEYAHKHKCQVHGFAFTSPTKVFQYDFDTVDSTSWMQLFRYGNITMFNGDVPKIIKNYKLKFDLNPKYGRNFGFAEWCKFSRRVELHWELKKHFEPKPLYI